MHRQCTRTPAHLGDEHVSYPPDQEVPFTLVHQRLLLPLQDPLEELAVDTDQFIQTGKQPVHHLLLKEQLCHHAPAVHVAHDLQRADVVQLCLHQL